MGKMALRDGSPASLVKATLAWLVFDCLVPFVGSLAGICSFACCLFIYLDDMITQQISLDSLIF